MREHDGFGLRGDGGFDQIRVDIMSGHVDIDEHRYRTELDNGIDRGGEASGYADHFIAFFDRTLA
ncbi:hypothetical protein D9M68_978390 [compost metagenome]